MTDIHPGFRLKESAKEHATDYDVIMMYEVFLGRNPENSFVIQNHKLQMFDVLFATFTRSSEFLDNVVKPIRRGEKVVRTDHTPAPSRYHIAWLMSRADLAQQQEMLVGSKTWEAFFNTLLRLPGFLPEELPAVGELSPRSKVDSGSAQPEAPSLLRTDGASSEPAMTAGAVFRKIQHSLQQIEDLLSDLKILVAALRPASEE